MIRGFGSGSSFIARGGFESSTDSLFGRGGAVGDWGGSGISRSGSTAGSSINLGGKAPTEARSTRDEVLSTEGPEVM